QLIQADVASQRGLIQALGAEMQINGTLLDHNGAMHAIADNVGFPKLIKHAVLAGLGPGFAFPTMIASWIGLALFSGVRFRLKADYIERLHPIYDPDEISMMSRLVGRSIADIYAKSHYGGTFTICYEHCCKWVGLSPLGKRPDFLSIDWGAMQVFSVEAKGFSKSSVSAAEFSAHKLQSTSSHPFFGATYGVASVTYDIYSSLKVRIEDPHTDQPQADPNVIRKIVDSYYKEIKFRLHRFLVPGAMLKEMPFSSDSHLFFDIGSLINPLHPVPIFMFIPKSTPPQGAERPVVIESETLYVDRDGIGVWAAPNNSFKPMPLSGTA
ncbi:hypothetical protein, partial [Xanthomonas graminis]|uniref:hypothetical protein n=2 Tax=Xanthomonas graminis TaxID=3390026 RepID=UPI000AD227E5